MATRIEVTADDIKAGERGIANKCPIAIAINRHFGPNARYPIVAPCEDAPGRWVVSWWQRGRVVNPAVMLPPECGMFASQFDYGVPVSPFSFVMDAEMDEAFAGGIAKP